MNHCFIPHLDMQVDIQEYAQKIFENALRIEYFDEDKICGFLGCYMNESENFSFITTISVEPAYHKKGIAQLLLNTLVNVCLANRNIHRIQLEVAEVNSKAISFYKKNNFIKIEQKSQIQILAKEIK